MGKGPVWSRWLCVGAHGDAVVRHARFPTEGIGRARRGRQPLPSGASTTTHRHAVQELGRRGFEGGASSSASKPRSLPTRIVILRAPKSHGHGGSRGRGGEVGRAHLSCSRDRTRPSRLVGGTRSGGRDVGVATACSPRDKLTLTATDRAAASPVGKEGAWRGSGLGFGVHGSVCTKRRSRATDKRSLFGSYRPGMRTDSTAHVCGP